MRFCACNCGKVLPDGHTSPYVDETHRLKRRKVRRPPPPPAKARWACGAFVSQRKPESVDGQKR